MIHGISDAPYCDLSKFLDYSEFLALIPEISAGIARCKDTLAIEGAFFKYPEHPNSSYKKTFTTLLDAFEQYNINDEPKSSLIQQWYSEKDNKLQAKNKFIRYLKSAYRGYDPMYSIHLAPAPWFEDCVAKDIIHWNYEAMKYFPKTLEWINNRVVGSVFSKITGMISIMYLEADGIPNEHRDGGQNAEHVNKRTSVKPTEQLLHLRTPNRGFYIFDPDTRDKIYVNAWACAFNTNDWHSTQRTLYPAWSLRIDGEYTDEVKKDIQWPI